MKNTKKEPYRCAKCGRELSELDEICDCGNALGVLNL